MNLESTILSNLVFNEKYVRKVLPFLKSEYFTARSNKIVYLETHEYITNYGSPPSLNALGIDAAASRGTQAIQQLNNITKQYNTLSPSGFGYDIMKVKN